MEGCERIHVTVLPVLPFTFVFVCPFNSARRDADAGCALLSIYRFRISIILPLYIGQSPVDPALKFKYDGFVTNCTYYS